MTSSLSVICYYAPQNHNPSKVNYKDAPMFSPNYIPYWVEIIYLPGKKYMKSHSRTKSKKFINSTIKYGGYMRY